MAGSVSRGTWQLLAYLSVVVAALVAVAAIEHHDARRAEKADHLSCDTRRILSANQKLVLLFLVHGENRERAHAPVTITTLVAGLHRLEALVPCEAP